MRLRILTLSLTIALALCAAAPLAAEARFFSPSSFWNTSLSSTAQLDARSPAWVQHLNERVGTYLSWINTTEYSTPIYTVPANQPRTWVYIEGWADQYQSPFVSVPMPANPIPADGTDHHIVISQPSTDEYYEFWNFYRGLNGYGALAGGRITAASRSNGIIPNVTGAAFPSPYGATATGLPIAGGLITPAELQNRRIDHALHITYPYPLHRLWGHSWPAQRSDGMSTDACDVPEGARFRLPANLNITALNLSPVADTIARAAQKYGMVVADHGGAVAFRAQDPKNLSSNPYPALFGGKSPNEVLKGFPWAKMQALKSQPSQGSWPAPNFAPC
jgi:hypothetical protein